ncbi:hypothetical protein IAD21_01309 [Abditibacteriota bacterium]|nr:hypothetical protein IAD21_01309 [Abditibacteriota bacterium]
MKSFLCLVAIIVLSSASAYAQTTQIPIGTPLTGLSPKQQGALDKARALARTARLWRRIIDCQEADSSTPEIAAHVQKMLGANAPVIEVRGEDNNHSTFALQQTRLGPMLCSIAELAGYKLWVLPSRLLLCSEEKLTEEEHATIKRGFGGEWKISSASGGGWNVDGAWEQVILKIVVDDIREHLIAKGQIYLLPPYAPRNQFDPPIPEGDFVPSYQLPFGELKTSSQQLLQELTDNEFRGFHRNSVENISPVLTPDVVVSVNDTKREQGTLFFKATETVDGKQSDAFYRWQIYKLKLPY